MQDIALIQKLGRPITFDHKQFALIWLFITFFGNGRNDNCKLSEINNYFSPISHIWLLITSCKIGQLSGLFKWIEKWEQN